jgi:hypothetical protein
MGRAVGRGEVEHAAQSAKTTELKAKEQFWNARRIFWKGALGGDPTADREATQEGVVLLGEGRSAGNSEVMWCDIFADASAQSSLPGS